MAPISPSSLVFLFPFCLSLLVAGDDGQPPFANLTEAIPQLNDLSGPDPKHVASLGNQNFTRCCLKAINASYKIEGGQVVQNFPNFTSVPYNELMNGQFPCGASFNGSYLGAPAVTVPYTWCRDHCPGWSHSLDDDLSAWISPFVGFILPAAVFCLNVRPPRRRRTATYT
jgi:hypothetical protein